MAVLFVVSVTGLVACSDGDPESVDTTAQFCQAYRTARAPANGTAAPDLTNASQVQAAIDQFANLAALAPDEIREDAHETEEVYRMLLEMLEGSAPSAQRDIVAALEPQLLGVALANERMVEWSNRNCQAAVVEATPTPTPTPLAIEG